MVLSINPDPNYRDPNYERQLTPEKGSLEEIDLFNAPPPGHSLTDTPGQMPYEKPPEFSDPEKAFAWVASKIQQPEVEDNFLKLMLGGVPIEAIVNTIAFAGFSQGKWTPDVSEIIKMPLSMHFIGLAVENKIPATVFNQDPETVSESRQISDEDTIGMMKENRPDMYHDLMAKLQDAEQGSMQTEGGLGMLEEQLPEEVPVPEEGSFLTAEEEI